MKFAKFTSFDGESVYLNPFNITRIYIVEHMDNMVCIDMVGDDMKGDSDMPYFLVRESLEQVIEELESI